TVEDVVHLSASRLAEKIRAGELSTTEVVRAFVERIEEIDPRLNAVVAPRFDAALREARQADAARSRGAALGPLHGVPITVKHSFDVAGMPTSDGVTLPSPAPRAACDAALVARLRRAGAIILGKTNVGQLLAMSDSANPEFGRTRNPWQLDRSPGGSSGGEAAIIAGGGSPLGLGSDAGGSIRQPAHCCGIHGLKPTSGRLSILGHAPAPNYPPNSFQPGPLARTVEDLKLAMKVLAGPDENPSDACSPPATWRDPNAARVASLRVGIYEDDGFFPAAPAMRRVVRSAAAALVDRGASVERFQPPDVEEAMEIYLGIFHADGLQWIRRRLGSSPRDWRIERLISHGRAPNFLRPIVSNVLRWMGHPRLARSMSLVRRRSVTVDGYWDLLQRQADYRRKFLAAMDAAGLDALVCPPHALPA
ncbi:MAG: amidase, partial [Planctomycetales bacterium]